MFEQTLVLVEDSDGRDKLHRAASANSWWTQPRADAAGRDTGAHSEGSTQRYKTQAWRVAHVKGRRPRYVEGFLTISAI